MRIANNTNNILYFLKWKYNLFLKNKYIARSEVKEKLELEKNNYLFFMKLKNREEFRARIEARIGKEQSEKVMELLRNYKGLDF